VKSDDWEYEKEFRLICPHLTDVKDHPLQLTDNYLSIGRDDLRSIILGCQVDAEAEQKISKLVADYAPHLKIRHAVRKRTARTV